MIVHIGQTESSERLHFFLHVIFILHTFLHKRTFSAPVLVLHADSSASAVHGVFYKQAGFSVISY